MKKTDRTETRFRKREEAMFSAGHLLWIAVSAALVAAGLFFCVKKRPDDPKGSPVVAVLG